MEKLSLSERLLNYLRNNPVWIHKGELMDKARGAGYLPDNAGRRLREMCEMGFIQKEERKGKGPKSVWYKIQTKETLF